MKTRIIRNNTNTVFTKATCFVKSICGEILYKGSPEFLPSIVFVNGRVAVKVGLSYFDVDTIDTIDGVTLARVF